MQPDHVTEAVSRVAALAAGAASRCGTTVVVAVDGRSGAGKTTYAEALGARLGAPVLHLDDVYPGWDGLEAAVSHVAEDVLAPLAAGEPAAYRRWDWSRSRPAGLRPVPATPRLVLEGAGAGALPAGAYAAVLVWLEAPDAVRKARALGRDGEVFARAWDRWAAQEERLLARDPVRDRADVVLDTTDWPGPSPDPEG